MSRLTDMLTRIELRRWPWQIKLHNTPLSPEFLFITEHVPDRDTGESIVLGSLDMDPVPPELTDPELMAWIYRRLQKHFLHELAEAFLIDGVRVFDPHFQPELEETNG